MWSLTRGDRKGCGCILIVLVRQSERKINVTNKKKRTFESDDYIFVHSIEFN